MKVGQIVFLIVLAFFGIFSVYFGANGFIDASEAHTTLNTLPKIDVDDEVLIRGEYYGNLSMGISSSSPRKLLEDSKYWVQRRNILEKQNKLINEFPNVEQEYSDFKLAAFHYPAGNYIGIICIIMLLVIFFSSRFVIRVHFVSSSSDS